MQNLIRDGQEDKPSLLETDWLKGWKHWKDEVYDDTGLRFGGDYNALMFGATDTLDGVDSIAASGVVRAYARWDVIGRGDENTGSLNFKLEHRHAYTQVVPAAFAPVVGYAGSLQSTFSDQGFRVTNLYWRQTFAEERIFVYAGFLDVTDFVDVYPLTSPWTGFNSFAFSTGSATIGGLPDGALGVMGAAWLTDSLYAIGSIADANGDPTDITGGFDTLINDFETFKSVELGWAPDRDRAFLEKISVSMWQVDSTDNADTGWGISGSASATIIDEWLIFLRGGWAHDGGSLFDRSVSVGFGYKPDPEGSLLGVGLNWGRPNRGTFPGELNDQLTSEVFYRWQVGQNLQVTPSIQLLVDPALNPDHEVVGVFGLRARCSF